MRKLFIILFVAMPLLALAQASGGQIRRKPQTTTSSKPSQRTNSTHKPVTAKVLNEREKAIIADLISSMVYVEGGTFKMGAIPDDKWKAWDQETPAHYVSVSSFYISKYEVSQELWNAIMNDNPSIFKGDKKPVENVTWSDCQEFIKKLNIVAGYKFRLPTEAEWEFAARGGNNSRGYKHAGSNNLDTVAWYEKNSYKSTHDVGLKNPNELGLYDMTGNVAEYCNDFWEKYSKSSLTNPTGPASGFMHIQRGGHWKSSLEYRYCHLSARIPVTPSTKESYIGFRLAL